MLVGRFFVIIPMRAIAGSLAAKKIAPPSAGTFPTHGGLFVGLLVGVILIVRGLTFFPIVALGPVAEQFAMQAGTLFRGTTEFATQAKSPSLLASTTLGPAILGPAYAEEAQYPRVFIHGLRQKLEDDPMHPKHILTELGVGYRLQLPPDQRA